MTGYGEAERSTAQGELRAELKTVNHRFLNLSVRTPPGFDRLEQKVQSWLRPFLSRGHAHLVLSLDTSAVEETRDDLPRLDVERARRYAEILRGMKEELALSGEVDVASVARFDGIFRAPDSDERSRPDVDVDEVRSVVEEAARAVVDMRETEGNRLRADMEERLRALEEGLALTEERAPERLERERDRLREAVRELLEGQEDVDEDRLAREIAYLAEKWDINEEIVRFRSHLGMFREALDTDSEEPVGKRLSFVVQEMHREANTIGAKANDAEIGRAAVAMKEEIERLREQVENVE